MERIRGAVLCVLLLGAFSFPVHAEDGGNIEAGVKMWLNTWTSKKLGYASATSDTTMLLGPAIAAKLGEQAFVEASYLFSTADYRFSEAGTTANVSRKDIDAAIGYLVIPEFGLFVGYKHMIFEKGATGIKDTVSGPVMGISLQAPVDRGLSLYGRAVYLFTRFEETGGGSSFQEDSPGWGLEAGLKYLFTRQFAGSIGYRFETNTGKESDVTDSFSGLVLSGMIQF